MKTLAVDWTAAGAIATGIGALAAFLTIAATLLVHSLQGRRDKAGAIRQNLQFIHSRQAQITQSIESGFLATIERQITEFRQRLGPTAEPGYFLDQLFGNGQASDRSLFRASALVSNSSSTIYTRMSDIWDGMNMKAFEFRGALCIFSYVSRVMTEEARRLCAPETTMSILDTMAGRGCRETLSKICSLDELVNTLLSDQIKLASDKLKEETRRTRHGCAFIGQLADKTIGLPDKDLVKLERKKLERKKVAQLSFNDLKTDPRGTIEKSLGNLRPPLSKDDLTDLRKDVALWNPQKAGTPPAESHLSEKALPELRG